MKTLNSVCRRELRAIAFSRLVRSQFGFRIIKWTCIIGGGVAFHDQNWFWLTLAGLATAGTLLHFFYRWKTRGWTRAWGGWDDLAAGRG